MRGLREIVFYLIGVLLIIVSIYFVYLNHQDFERAMVRQAESYLLATARSQAQSIEKYIGDILAELETLSSSPILKGSIAFSQNKSGIEAEYYYLLQDSYREVERLVDAIYLIDGGGTVVNVSPFKPDITGQDFSRMPDVRTVLAEHQPYTSGVFESLSQGKVIANIYPVFVDSKFSGMLRAIILVERISSLTSHINEEGSRRVIISDNRGIVISHPDKSYIGQATSEVFSSDKFFGYGREQAGSIAAHMRQSQEGATVVARTLIAYCPIHIGSNFWSIAVAMDYSVISSPIIKNARNNLIFAGFIFLIFFAAGMIYYRTHKKKDELLISTATLDIINKQLHLEIKERKEIQQELQDYLHGGKKNAPPQ